VLTTLVGFHSQRWVLSLSCRKLSAGWQNSFRSYTEMKRCSWAPYS